MGPVLRVEVLPYMVDSLPSKRLAVKRTMARVRHTEVGGREEAVPAGYCWCVIAAK